MVRLQIMFYSDESMDIVLCHYVIKKPQLLLDSKKNHRGPIILIIFKESTSDFFLLKPFGYIRV